MAVVVVVVVVVHRQVLTVEFAVEIAGLFVGQSSRLPASQPGGQLAGHSIGLEFVCRKCRRCEQISSSPQASCERASGRNTTRRVFPQSPFAFVFALWLKSCVKPLSSIT